jgi:hypothetical protein
VLGFALEVREFLLVEQRTDLVGDLARMVRTALAPTPEAVEAFLKAYLDGRTLKALVFALPRDAVEIPAALAELLDAAPGDTLGRLIDLLAEEGEGPRSPLLRRLLVRGCRHSPETLVTRLREVKGSAAVALLRLLAEIDPQAACHASAEASTAADAALQREALRHLETAAFSPEMARALHHLVESPYEDVRLAALPVMAARGGPRVFPALLAHVEKHAARLGTAEATAAGRALAQSSARSTLQTFETWLRPKAGGLLGRLVKMHAPLPDQRVALGGLPGIPGDEATALLGLLAERGDAGVAEAAAVALQARPRGGMGGRRG